MTNQPLKSYPDRLYTQYSSEFQYLHCVDLSRTDILETQFPAGFACHVSKSWLLMVLQISSATASFSTRNFSASALSGRNSALIQYPHPSFTITPCEEAISRISDSRQIPLPNPMSIPASFRTAGANLFLMICTDIPMPVAWRRHNLLLWDNEMYLMVYYAQTKDTSYVQYNNVHFSLVLSAKGKTTTPTKNHEILRVIPGLHYTAVFFSKSSFWLLNRTLMNCHHRSPPCRAQKDLSSALF